MRSVVFGNAPMIEWGKVSHDMFALYGHRTLVRIGFGISTVFTVALIYQYFQSSFFAVSVVYGSIYTGVFFLTPISSRFIRYLGVRNMLLIAMPAVVLATVGLYQFAGGSPYAPYGLVAFVMLMIVYKVLYWVPYHVDFTRLLDRRHRGGQLALLRNASDLLIVIMPFIGGTIVASFGFDVLYLAAIAIVSLAIVPIFSIRTVYESYSWGYLRTMKELVLPRNRYLVLAYVGDGIQNVTLTVIWPLFVFILLNEKYVALGLITALTLFAVLLLRLATGNLFDTWNKSRLIVIGAILASSGWLLKVLVATPFQIFAVDTYHGMGRVVNRTSFDAMTYELSADNGRYVDEYTTLKEMALAIGRIAMLAATMGIFALVNLHAAFIIALLISAGAALSTMLLRKRVVLY